MRTHTSANSNNISPGMVISLTAILVFIGSFLYQVIEVISKLAQSKPKEKVKIG